MGRHHWLGQRTRHEPRPGLRPARGLALVLTLVLAIPVLAGCATPTGPGAGTTGDTSTPSANPGTTGSTPTTPGAQGTGGEEDPGDVLDPKLPGTAKTLRGTVAAGVEANCMLLSADDGKSYLLIGGDRQVITGGGRIEVVGQIQPDLMTTCQQGIPVTVSTARKI